MPILKILTSFIGNFLPMKKPEKQFRILIERIRSDNNSTVGKMYFNGDLQCYTLEDGHHDKKILGRTRIAQGVYILSLRKYGGKHKKYAKKYKGGPFLKHIGMIELNDVPDFTDILIHVGNSHHDTAGMRFGG